MKIYIYEDDAYENFLPLAHFRPVFELRPGRFTLLERIERLYPGRDITLLVRDQLAGVVRERHPRFPVNQFEPGTGLFLSGRTIFDRPLPAGGEETVFVAGGDIVGVRADTSKFTQSRISADSLKIGTTVPVAARTVRHLWDLLPLTASELKSDFSEGKINGELDPRAAVYGDRSQIFIAGNARVEAGVVIHADTGPVYIDDGAVVRSPSIIDGPCYIGRGTVIDGAKIRSGCSFGPCCRIAGEVEASIFQGYGNKHHDGFLGHAYIGEWVNLGAGTTNSDLKNNYGTVRVQVGSKQIDTGQMKVGAFIGDHAKTAIGTLIPTGAVVGVFANILGGGLAGKTVASFSWGEKGRYDMAKAVDTARTVMNRRGVALTPAYEQLIQKLNRDLV